MRRGGVREDRERESWRERESRGEKEKKGNEARSAEYVHSVYSGVACN